MSKDRPEAITADPKEEEALQRAVDLLLASRRIPQDLFTALSGMSFVALSGDSHATPYVPADDPVPAHRSLGRYQDQGIIGQGGMGEVRRVRDPELKRTMAMKMLRGDRSQGLHRQQFVEEAQVTAQLQHPGIPAVHELGELEDGRPYFTMAEVGGSELRAVLKRGWAGDPSWPLRRLVTVFHAICTTVAYAHAQFVVHRDLKPSNVMVGAFGEVLVMDWGLTSVGRNSELELERGPLAAWSGDRSVAGTPVYMSPEAARGDGSEVGPRTDVYTLGVMLYELISGRRPREGDALLIIGALRLGVPIPEPTAQERLPWRVPAGLASTAMRALSHRPEDRHADAGELAADVEAWLDGAQRRERALVSVAEADRLALLAQRQRSQALALKAAATAKLQQLGEQAGAREPANEDRQRARDLTHEAEQAEEKRLSRLMAALEEDPENVEAHDRMAAFFRARHEAAEHRRRPDAASTAMASLRNHDRGQHAAYILGVGALTLHTDPPGAQVTLHHLQERGLRWVVCESHQLGPTPIVAHTLPMGRFVAEIHHPDRHLARYPVFIRRQEHWNGVPPGSEGSEPVELPRRGCLAPDEVWVAAGWFFSGRPDQADDHPVPWRRLWCHSFVIKRDPVTNAAYRDFLNALLDRGEADKAASLAPRPPSYGSGEDAPSVYPLKDGRYVLGVDAQGHRWSPTMPVVLVNWHMATAYAAHVATQTGLPWRLPLELEWEKAGRGVDGRIYPWGDVCDAAFARIRSELPGRQGPAPIDRYPIDTSVYGVRGMAGNVSDWMADTSPHHYARALGQRVDPTSPAASAPGRRRLKGGSWAHTGFMSRLDRPGAGIVAMRTEFQGIRLVRSIDLPPRDSAD
jgi:eukaryotic-like serine/threonine-protein kinase